MEELDTKKYAGIDLGKTSVQFSIYREGQEEMSEESFPIAKEQQEAYIETGIHLVEEYMKEKEYQWSDYQAVHFSMQDPSEENRDKLKESVSEEFLNILNMKYGTLSYIDCKNDKTTRVYAPAVGMLYILDKYTSLEINENTDEYVFQQNINNSFINKEQSEILKGIILTELYLDIIQNSVNEVLYLENRVTIKQFIKDDIDDEEVKFKCDLLVSFKIEDKIQSYFIKYIDKDYDIRRYMELIKKFDTFVKDEELVDRYCIISDKKPKLVFIADTQELMQDLFNTIINYNIDFNNICLSCLDVVFKDKESKRFKEEDAFLDIAAYV